MHVFLTQPLSQLNTEKKTKPQTKASHFMWIWINVLRAWNRTSASWSCCHGGGIGGRVCLYSSLCGGACVFLILQSLVGIGWWPPILTPEQQKVKNSAVKGNCFVLQECIKINEAWSNHDNVAEVVKRAHPPFIPLSRWVWSEFCWQGKLLYSQYSGNLACKWWKHP